MDIELVKQIIIVAIASSIISTAIVQKVKEQLKSKKWLFFVGLVVSIGIGIAFASSFSELSLLSSVWVGIVSWIGADAIYKAFEDKIFKSFSNIDNAKTIVIERDDE
ncbi:MAG: hypothetical protein IJB83_02740 [Bacilli bacterium]|nr:hypothetical protein [Bacilli bacterium]